MIENPFKPFSFSEGWVLRASSPNPLPAPKGPAPLDFHEHFIPQILQKYEEFLNLLMKAKKKFPHLKIMDCKKSGLMLGSGSLWSAAGVLEQRAEFYLNLVQICPTTPHHLSPHSAGLGGACIYFFERRTKDL